VTLAGQEIQANLRRFVKRWSAYAGSEKAEAQTFLNELFACYGTDRQAAGVHFEENQPRPGGGRGFLDALWPGLCLIEMKRPSEAVRLSAHRRQALDYWRDSADAASDRPAVDYVVLCAFARFEIWEPGRFPRDPRAIVDLAELPDRYDTLLFLAGQRPLFAEVSRHLTTQAAEATVRLYQALFARDAADPQVLQAFVLQTVWCLFASSLALLPGHPVRHILNGLLHDGSGLRSSAADLGTLFALLNERDLRGRGGVYAQTRYVNGGLFEHPARVHLEREELELLAEAAGYDWAEVDPTIFGSLIEGFLPRDRAVAPGGARTQFGVHYTHEADIMKIVVPTIVEPWTANIQAATTVDEAVRVLTALCRLRVLDPACGSGNFLFIAYRELRELERQATQRILQMAAASGVAVPTDLPQYPLTNLHGIEIDPFAARVTRLVLWMGHKLAADRYGSPEPPLPLPDLDEAIIQDDALKTPWPQVDVIIGNPPFNGSQLLRRDLGDDYLRFLEREFRCGIRDFCTYWFRRAADHLPPGGRAGLVGTNSVGQGRGREASLDYVLQRDGVIVDAHATQKWPGEAKVHVAIVNWIKAPHDPVTRFRLGALDVPDGIAADLVPAAQSTIGARPLSANRGMAFQGPIPVGDGFILSQAEAHEVLQRGEADYAAVVRPYLIGDDIAEDPAQRPRRWIIDFGTRSLDLEEAAEYPAALALVRERVKPERDRNVRSSRRERWWLFGELAVGMREALRPLRRYLAVGATAKRTLFTWCEPAWCPSNLLYVVALDDDTAFGVLSSSAHRLWAARRGSTLETRARYTNTTVFDTFPWPDPDSEQRERIAAAARGVVNQRARACEGRRGLTDVYNLLDDGGFRDLAATHRELDMAVAAAYGWPANVAGDPYEVIPRLMALNADIAAGRRAYTPFPGRGQAVTASELPLAYRSG
jgi:hypothetical protein